MGVAVVDVDVRPFGEFAGIPVRRFTMSNSRGVSVALIEFGARIQSVRTPDRANNSAEITLGFDTMAEYARDRDYYGATIGRCANRIASGQFEIAGETFRLARNNGGNHLHGGVDGFDRRVWKGCAAKNGSAVEFSRVSPAGEEHYPGELHASVVYSLSEENVLTVDFEARVDAPSPVNLTNHAYWNLSGRDGTAILDHELQLFCDHYLPVDAALIPTGDVLPVTGTAMDFVRPKPIGADIGAVVGGYDHSYVRAADAGVVTPLARLACPDSGRTMIVSSSLPAVQLYTGNFIADTPGRAGTVYRKHGGLCLEPQFHPDAVNRNGFPDVVLHPNAFFRHRIEYAFGIMEKTGAS